MGNEETLSKQEIIELIEKGDRYAGVKFEEVNDKVKTAMEAHEALERKIDCVSFELEAFRSDANLKFSALFEDNQRFFEELRSMRKDLKEFYERFDIVSRDFYGQRKA